MAAGCALITKGRGLDCNRIAGGIKYVYFGVYDTTTVTQSWTGATAGETTDIAMAAATKLYRYSLPRGTASFTDTLVGSRENGTIYYTPTVQILLGGKNGMQLNAGTDTSGAALGDRNGYDLTFDGVEAHPASIVSDYTSTPFDNADSGSAIPIQAS